MICAPCAHSADQGWHTHECVDVTPVYGWDQPPRTYSSCTCQHRTKEDPDEVV